MWESLIGGFAIAVTPWNLLYAGLGAAMGTAIGVLPGLGPPATIAMLLPLSYGMEPVSAVIMLAGIFYGAMYGGSITSILLNIPGEAATVVTCLDGYRMARAGRAGAALGMSAIASFVAGTFGVLGLSLVSPLLANFALRFGPAEYFSLVLLGLIMAVYLSEGSPLKGLMMATLGLILGTVGLDPVLGAERFTFGILRLTDGLDFVVVAMGLFGIAEVLRNLEKPEHRAVLETSIKGLFPNLEDWRRSWGAVTRGSLIGFFIGVLPGGGATISSFVSYAVEKRVSKNPDQFGTGVIQGVAAPEAANNAASSSSFIPLLTLGIPGNASIAMIFVALMIHGIRPGPQFI
ncbi:MAG TPA: tripartite tricarboxylate transporter permease, partial [Xanthobacteraceae bacterium]|nr:tripartite tricarboxylate transporter permease [Xanthobacteraceae bacterium]